MCESCHVVSIDSFAATCNKNYGDCKIRREKGDYKRKHIFLQVGQSKKINIKQTGQKKSLF